MRYELVAYVLNPPGSAGKAATYTKIYGSAKTEAVVEEHKEVYGMSLRGGKRTDLDMPREPGRTIRIYSEDRLTARTRVEKSLFTIFLKKLNRRVHKG